MLYKVEEMAVCLQSVGSPLEEVGINRAMEMGGMSLTFILMVPPAGVGLRTWALALDLCPHSCSVPYSSSLTSDTPRLV